MEFVESVGYGEYILEIGLTEEPHQAFSREPYGQVVTHPVAF